ncbi:hypothetical protein AYO38_06935 [bacterium SCGC AG-212-C10]|nr:hypothetical protein AYO38_06935 [bacterium SCGC AG-212-C10]
MVQLPSPRPPRLLAIDPGERRTGVAVSDELGMFAHARPAIHHKTSEELLIRLRELVRLEEPAELVVGLPLSLSGGDSAHTRHVRALVTALRAALPIRVTEWDERLSSVQAARTRKGEANRKSGALDSASAAVVLQSVMDSRASAGQL